MLLLNVSLLLLRLEEGCVLHGVYCHICMGT